jgi:hypothetical protein
MKIVVEGVGFMPYKVVAFGALPASDGVCEVCAFDADSVTLETQEGRVRVYYDERPPVHLDEA